jgi:hypothetical protein
MKNVKISLLTLCVGTSIAFAASAGTRTTTPTAPLAGTNFTMNAVITNTPPPTVLSINGTPVFDDLGSNSPYGVVYTDGSGKIDGVEDMIFTNLDLCEFTTGDFITDIGGSISTVGGTKRSAASTVVQMTMKGNGYVQGSQVFTQAQAALNLTFKGTLSLSNPSPVTVTGTNAFLLIGTNGSAFTNEYVYLPSTNISLSPTYQELVFVVQDSYVQTNVSAKATNLSVDSTIYTYTFPFGSTLSTNGENIIVPGNATNLFTNVVIAYFTNIYYSTATNSPVITTNAVYGLDYSQVTNFIADALAAGTNYNFNIYTNFGADYREVELVYAYYTNSVQGSASTNSGVYVYDTYYTNLGVFSNYWYEVDGTLKGQITAGKCKQSFNATNASFFNPYTYYTLATGTGSNTSAPYFGTNKSDSWIATNDSGITYVISESSSGDGMSTNDPFGLLDGTVKQFGKNLWFSGGDGEAYGLSGTGSLNPAKSTYKLNLLGIAQAMGSSLVVTGATATNVIVGYTGTTVINQASVDNLAAIGGVSNAPVSANFTNVNYAYFYFQNTNVLVGEFYMTTNQVVGGMTNSYYLDYVLPVQYTVVTNTVDSIRSIFANGKVMGQKVSGSGVNADIPITALDNDDPKRALLHKSK